MEAFLLGVAKAGTLRLACASQPWQGREVLAVTWDFLPGEVERSVSMECAHVLNNDNNDILLVLVSS